MYPTKKHAYTSSASTLECYSNLTSKTSLCCALLHGIK